MSWNADYPDGDNFVPPSRTSSFEGLVTSWLALNVLTWAIALYVSFALIPEIVSGWFLVISLSVPFALCQWLCLAKYIANPGRFLLYTLSGWVIGAIVGVAMATIFALSNPNYTTPEYFLRFGLPWGLTVSFFQYGYWESRARLPYLWFLLNSIALVGGIELFGYLLNWISATTNPIIRIGFPATIGGVFYFVVSVPLLLWLLQHPKVKLVGAVLKKSRLLGLSRVFILLGVVFFIAAVIAATLTEFKRFGLQNVIWLIPAAFSFGMGWLSYKRASLVQISN